MRGIYILANDNRKVMDDSVALLNSLRRNVPDLPVLMIPFNDQYHETFNLLRHRFNVELYDNEPVNRELERLAALVHGRPVPAIRKLSCWFGPFDEFVYIDTDIVVLQGQEDVFGLLKDYDIVYCGSGRYLGIRHVFTDRVLERNLFSKEDIDALYNTGFFASKKGVLTFPQVQSLLEEAAGVADIFEGPGPQEQPLLNYITLRAIKRRANIREMTMVTCDAWAGSELLVRRRGRASFKDDSPVRHVHWAGFKSIPRRPHLNLWLEYRYPGSPIRRGLRRLSFGCSNLAYAARRYAAAIKRRMPWRSGTTA